MHELALSEDIVRTVLNATGADKEHVTAIAVEVGALSTVSASSLEFCLRLVLDQGGMEHTAVHITQVPATVQCECGLRYDADDMFGACPACGSYAREVVNGKDVRIDYVEVEDEKS
jgi:hydrogenase nickel incorporation protein HypA/HybF